MGGANNGDQGGGPGVGEVEAGDGEEDRRQVSVSGVEQGTIGRKAVHTQDRPEAKAEEDPLGLKHRPPSNRGWRLIPQLSLCQDSTPPRHGPGGTETEFGTDGARERPGRQTPCSPSWSWIENCRFW